MWWVCADRGRQTALSRSRSCEDRHQQQANQALVLAADPGAGAQVDEAFSRDGAHLPQINVLPILRRLVVHRAVVRLRRGRAGGGGHTRRRIDHSKRGTLRLSRWTIWCSTRRRDAGDGLRRRVERSPGHTPEYKQWRVLTRTSRRRSASSPPKYLHDPTEVKARVENATRREHSKRYIQVAGQRRWTALTGG